MRDYAVASGIPPLYVQQVYERHRNGCKACVSIYGDPGSTLCDSWFWHTQVEQGSVVAVTVSQGWGPHTCRDDVLFIGAQNHAGVRDPRRWHRAPGVAPSPSTAVAITALAAAVIACPHGDGWNCGLV